MVETFNTEGFRISAPTLHLGLVEYVYIFDTIHYEYQKADFIQKVLLQCIYNPIMAMGFSAMFTFQLDNTKR